MIIDSHQHFWQYDLERDTWIDENMGVLKRDFMPSDLYPIFLRENITGSIAVQADQSETETNFLLDCARKNSFIKGVVGWVDLQAADVANRLAYFSKNPLFKGVRHILQAEDISFFKNPNFISGLGHLASYGLTYDLLVYHHQLAAAVELVDQFPTQTFIVNHIAKPNIDKDLCKKWKKNIRTLASYKNVYCKVSGLVTETDNKKWNESCFTPFIDTVSDAFGADRLLFGSDWPVCLLNGNYECVLKLIKNYFKSYAQKDRDKIFGLNSIKIYNLAI